MKMLFRMFIDSLQQNAPGMDTISFSGQARAAREF